MGLKEPDVSNYCIRQIDLFDVLELLREPFQFALDVSIAHSKAVWAESRTKVCVRDPYSAGGKAVRQEMGAIGLFLSAKVLTTRIALASRLSTEFFRVIDCCDVLVRMSRQDDASPCAHLS